MKGKTETNERTFKSSFAWKNELELKNKLFKNIYNIARMLLEQIYERLFNIMIQEYWGGMIEKIRIIKKTS